MLSNDENVGDRLRCENQMRLFSGVIEQDNLFDLGWKGSKYTWCNRHEDESFTKERQDRALANKKWMDYFYEIRVETLTTLCSDHRPIRLECVHGRGYDVRSLVHFKYEASWSKEEGCSDTIKSA